MNIMTRMLSADDGITYPGFVPDLGSYDKIIVGFSGGKDSLALVLYLLYLGVPPWKIELWHHEVDGREGSTLMDWPCTHDYCAKVAEALGIEIFYSWRIGGFEAEMLRENARTQAVRFEMPDGSIVEVGGKGGSLNTRMLYPQVGADLQTRWCSPYLKIMVGDSAIRNQDRFLGKRILFLTGERAEESANRAGYAEFEPDRSDNRDGKKAKRHVDRWRAVLRWTEDHVWYIIRRFGIVPHPAYYLGWGRVSCAACIFGSANQWASLRIVNPQQFSQNAAHEASFKKTIHRNESIIERADRGTPYVQVFDAELVALARSAIYSAPVKVDPAAWILPAGAYGESTGPT